MKFPLYSLEIQVDLAALPATGIVKLEVTRLLFTQANLDVQIKAGFGIKWKICKFFHLIPLRFGLMLPHRRLPGE